MRRITVEAPATSANLGPGFDVLALALQAPVDVVEISVEGSGPPSVKIGSVGADVPDEPRKNAASVVVLAMLRKFKVRGAIRIRLTKGVPVGVGLGSSGASSAAAAAAMDKLFGLNLSVQELIAHAGAGERAASGAPHLDNATAAILGGFVIVSSEPEARPVKFEAPPSLRVVVATPRVRLPERKTEYARSLLPAKVALDDLVKNVSRASVMVAGFANKDVAMIGEGMEDAVVEPARAKMVPGLQGARKAAKEAGAAGACISGAGPSVLSFVDVRKADPAKVLGAVLGSFRARGVVADGFVTSAGKGARVIEGP